MLVGSGRWSAGTYEIESVVVVDRAAWAFGIWRRHLVLDSRFLCPAAERRGVATLYVVAAGSLEPRGGLRVEGPSLWVLDEDEFERVGEGSRTFRSWGAPAAVVAVTVPANCVRVPIGLVAGQRPLEARAVEAVERMRASPEVERKQEAFRDLLESLARAGVLDPSTPAALEMNEPSQLTRLWSAVASLYQSHDTSTYLDLLAETARLSPRQLQREGREIAARLGLSGFRDALRYARLRHTALLLSAPDLSIADIAKLVGYGSTDALGRAFRDAGLPAPRTVRELLAQPQ